VCCLRALVVFCLRISIAFGVLSSVLSVKLVVSGIFVSLLSNESLFPLQFDLLLLTGLLFV
jgi:hypothetical protein